MKKIALSLMTFMMLALTPTQLRAEKNMIPTAKIKKVESAEARVLLNRLNEIKAMDISKMNASERKVIRQEVKALRTNLRDINGGVYLSVGAIIIILLLLILIL